MNGFADISSLFETCALGDLRLPNRMVMAPMTRARAAQPNNVPSDLNAHYYVQRASAGLIVTESTQISEVGRGYGGTPGIHTREQVEGWRIVTGAVHAAGGRIYCQLWHTGRVSHLSLQPQGENPVEPAEFPGAFRIGADAAPVNPYRVAEFVQFDAFFRRGLDADRPLTAF